MINMFYLILAWRRVNKNQWLRSSLFVSVAPVHGLRRGEDYEYQADVHVKRLLKQVDS